MTATPQQPPRFRGVLSDAHAQLARRIDAHEQGGQSVPCRVSAFPSWWVSDDPDERAAAARACADCPVLTDCKAAATDSKERFGVWGGKDFTPAKRPEYAPTCTMKDCEQPTYARGFCRRHYNALWYKGGVEAIKAAMPTCPPLHYS